LVVGVSQMLWLNFAPILSLIQSRYHVSELTASMLLLVFPLLYVFLSVPAGALTDSRGYRFAAGLGAFAMAAFAWVRIFDSSFWTLLAGQVGIALAQPYVVNGISKLVADWFSENEGALATGLGTMGMFLGMALGMALTPSLVQSIELKMTMVVFAVISTVIAFLFIWLVHPNTHANVNAAEAGGGFGPLLRNRNLIILSTVAFLGMGVFNGLTTWLEQILAPHGIGSEQAGLIGGALIVGGIVGAVAIPVFSDAVKRRKPFLIVCAAAALATIYPLCTNNRYTLLLILAGLHGFFFMPAFALLLEMCGQIAGLRHAGAATSLLMLAGNAGGVVVIVAMPIVKGAAPDFQPAVLLMAALMGLALVLVLFAPETFARAEAPAGVE
jgi:predicted MFS family arabinose efflux permease